MWIAMIGQATTLFEGHLAAEKGFSIHTVRAYVKDLEQFCDYVACGPDSFGRPPEERPPASLDALRRAQKTDVRAFLAHVQTAGGTARTSARKLASIRAAYRFFVRTGAVDADPTVALRSPKLARGLP
ncbi:MAG: hypothetical protein FJY92_08685, partial [Candidatus Hydrogenedentes bacterium]|nr:hypothetical protein [Candidatus Hydrogenedentota bacterium]